MKGLGVRRLAALSALATAIACGSDTLGPLGADDSASAALGPFGGWSQAVRIETTSPGAHPKFNTTFLDGCPSSSRDGKTFYMATNRPDKNGVSHGIDIYVSRRATVTDPWGEPERLAEPINSESNDFCPMPGVDEHDFFFVSNRAGACGGTVNDDIYFTRFRDDGTVETPQNLGCDVNSAGNEAGPVPVEEPGRGAVLYFSSTRAGGFSPDAAGAVTGDADIYSSESKAGKWQPAVLVPGVNSAQEDGQPYVRRDALEIYFFSTRPDGKGAQDIWMTSRAKAQDAWSTPVNLGDSVNGPAAETRPSLSWDGTTLYFGSTRGAGDSNIFTSVRERVSR
jgi:hypothetical protein